MRHNEWQDVMIGEFQYGLQKFDQVVNQWRSLVGRLADEEIDSDGAPNREMTDALMAACG